MGMLLLERPIFFSVRKNRSYIYWTPYGDFFKFNSVCVEVVSGTEFVLYEGDCAKVYRLGRKLLIPATRYRMLQNGIYLLEGEEGGRYKFRLVRPITQGS
jgi:hypothetical protein